MTTYNVKWLLDRIAEKLEYDSTEPDQAFGGTTADPYKRIRDWLNEFYTETVNEVRLEAPKEGFEVTHQFTWEDGESTYTFSNEVAASKSLYLRDITNGEPGEELRISSTYRSGAIWWKNRTTLQHYNTTGWSADRTLVLHYLADAEELVDDAQVPVLIPYRHRYLLVWGTAWMARREVDEEAAPRSWEAKVHKMKQDYLLDLTQGRMELTVPPSIRSSIFDANQGAVL